MKLEFKEATKQQSKLRCTVFGPSGSGKTFTSLSIARGILNFYNNGKIAVIDTERGRAKKHSKKFKFDVLELTDYSISSYISAIKVAADNKYEILIIDSLTHAWQTILEEVDKLGKTKFKGNTFQAWSEGTPMQKKLINQLLSYPGHLICTMRSKTDWIVEKNDKGKNEPKRIGTTPEQGKGIEYEFDFIIEMDSDHNANIWKGYDNFQDRIILPDLNNRETPAINLGIEFMEWLNDGELPILEEKITPYQLERFNYLISELDISPDKVNAGLKMKNVESKEQLTEEIAANWIKSLEERLQNRNKEQDVL